MSRFSDLLARLAAFSDEQMGRPWDWPGHPGPALEVRYVHWFVHQAEVAALAAAAAAGPGASPSLPPAPPAGGGEAAAVMAAAQSEWGDLRGLLAGQPDYLLDADPGGGEWTLRQLLAHVLLTERRYAAQVRHAVGRPDGDPLHATPPSELDPAETGGGVAGWIDLLDRERKSSDASCAELIGAALARPTIWAGHEVDVRFRLLRFAAHIAEHTVQAGKVLRALGQPPGEAREAVRRISRARGAHERRSPRAALDRLDAEAAALLASVRIAG